MGCGCFHHLSQQRIRGHLNEGEQNTTQTPPPLPVLVSRVEKAADKNCLHSPSPGRYRPPPKHKSPSFTPWLKLDPRHPDPPRVSPSYCVKPQRKRQTSECAAKPELVHRCCGLFDPHVQCTKGRLCPLEEQGRGSAGWGGGVYQLTPCCLFLRAPHVRWTPQIKPWSWGTDSTVFLLITWSLLPPSALITGAKHSGSLIPIKAA